jgi:mRNA interferase MazF
MTTGSRPAPFRIGIRHGGKKSLIQLDQIRTIDKTRLVKRAGGPARGAPERHAGCSG